MKLQVTLALLLCFLVFCFSVTTTAAIITSCYENAGTFFSTDKGDIQPCGSTGNSCVMYTDKYTGLFVRSCSDAPKETACTATAKAKRHTCISCDSRNNCNDTPFKLNCYSYSGTSTSNIYSSITLCPLGICIMYRHSEGYKRSCAKSLSDCKIYSGATLCTTCNSERCNKDSFVSSILKCNEYVGYDATSLGHSKLCPSGTCIMYKDDSKKYIRSCTSYTGDCTKVKLGGATLCTQCNTDNCNKDSFVSSFLQCNEYVGYDATSLGHSKLCPSGTCIMYKDSNKKYIRSCTSNTGGCKTLYAGGARLCTQCNTDNCNKDSFVSSILQCYEYFGNDVTNLGTPKTCPSGTCIMYMDNSKNYIRSCTSYTGDCAKVKASGATLCTQCNTEKCNKDSFVDFESILQCNEYVGIDPTDLGQSKLCPSGICIMYMDSNKNYIRSCVDDKIRCSAMKATATQCAECRAENCNNVAFNACFTGRLRAP